MRLSFRRAFLVFFLCAPAIARAENGDGCTVSIVQPNSAADRAGMHIDDVLLEGGGKSISNMRDLHIAVTPVDGEFPMKVDRDGDIFILVAQVHSSPSQPKLGIQCIPVTTIAVTVPVAPPDPSPAPQPAQVAEPNIDLLAESSALAPMSPSLNCPFPFPNHAKVSITLHDGHRVQGKLIRCSPQEVTIRSGLLSGTFDAVRVAKIELLP